MADPAVVQSKGGFIDDFGDQIVVVLDAPVASGNAVIIAWVQQPSATGLTITDDKSNNYLWQSPSFLYCDDTTETLVLYGTVLGNITNGPQTFTMNVSADTGYFLRFWVVEVSNIAALSNPLDGFVAGNNGVISISPGETADAIHANTITTTVDGCFIWSAAASGGYMPVHGTDYVTDVAIDQFVKFTGESKVQTTHGAITPTWTAQEFTGTLTYCAIALALKPLAGAPAAVFKLEDAALDGGLTAVKNNANQIYVCTAQPTSYADAVTKLIGAKDFGTGSAVGAISVGSPSGRKASSIAVTGGTVSTNGTPGAWAIVDSVNSVLYASGPLSGAVAVTTTDNWTLEAITLHMNK